MPLIQVDTSQPFAPTWVDANQVHHVGTLCREMVGLSLISAVLTPGNKGSVKLCSACLEKLRGSAAERQFNLGWLQKEQSKNTGPTTFKDLVRSTGWRAILRLLKKTGKEVRVAESAACMGEYSAIVLTGEGFQLETGKAGMTAAFTSADPHREPLRRISFVRETAIAFSAPLEDDPPGTPTPSEADIVENLLKEVKAIRDSQSSQHQRGAPQ